MCGYAKRTHQSLAVYSENQLSQGIYYVENNSWGPGKQIELSY